MRAVFAQPFAILSVSIASAAASSFPKSFNWAVFRDGEKQKRTKAVMLPGMAMCFKDSWAVAEASRKAKANKKGSAWLEGPYPIRKVEAALFMLGAELPPIE